MSGIKKFCAAAFPDLLLPFSTAPVAQDLTDFYLASSWHQKKQDQPTYSRGCPAFAGAEKAGLNDRFHSMCQRPLDRAVLYLGKKLLLYQAESLDLFYFH